MATLSMGMIVRDEAKTLARILRCATAFCDQLVVVDTGSRDDTVDIARACGAEIHVFPWVDDFAAARNVAFSHCTGDWLIWLDADDVVPPDVQQTIVRLKSTLFDTPGINTIMAGYRVNWDGQGRVTEVYERERFVRRSLGCRWSGPVHETLGIPAEGIVRCAEVYVEHRPHPDNIARKKGRNLAIYEKWIDVEAVALHDLYQYACELQWNDRPADCAATFEILFRRWGDRPDPTGELYLARIKAGECRAITGSSEVGLRHYQAAIALDPTRAEALCLAGELYMRSNAWPQALACLERAARLEVPAFTGKYVFPWFYGDRPRAALERCRRSIGPTTAAARA